MHLSLNVYKRFYQVAQDKSVNMAWITLACFVALKMHTKANESDCGC